MSVNESGIELTEDGWGIVPTVEEVKEIIKSTKNECINIKETILNATASEWMEENYFVLSFNGKFIFEVMEAENLKYNFLSDEYFEFIDNLLEDGIYIALGYACEECGRESNIEGEIGTGVIAGGNNIHLSLPKDAVIGDMETDYGIQVFKKDDQYETIFSFNDSISYGHAMGYQKISSIEDKLEEPLHRVLIKLMNDAIIFEE